MNRSSTLPYTMTTPPSPRPSSSFKIMFSSDNSSLALQSHIFWYRSPRPLTLPYLPPKLLYLSCWWIGDSTDFWGHSLETTSLQFSELSSHSQRNNGEHIAGPMDQCREQCRMDRRMKVCPLIPEPILSLHVSPGPLPLPNPCPLLILPSTLLPRWHNEPTLSHIAPELLPFPQGNNIVATLHWLNKAGEGLTNEALLEWALDVLCSLEDWRWLWSWEPATTLLSSPTLNQPLPMWYGVSNASPLNTSVSSV